MTQVLKYISAAAFFLIFCALGAILFKEGFVLLSLFSVVIGILSLFVWVRKDTLSYRFLYPGMICFLLFTIFPIFFSVFISFTNLGTGHFFSQDRVKQLLLDERMLIGEGKAYPFELRKEKNDVFLYTENLSARIFPPTKGAQKVSLEVSTTKIGPPLPPKKVIGYKKLLKGRIYTTPSGRSLIYHRVDKLIEGQKVYKQSGNSLTNRLTGKTYVPDLKSGFYREKESQESLRPGFYTTIGFKNYLDLFRKKDFQKTFLKVSTWTFIWAIISVFLTFSLGMSLALFINDKSLRFKAFYRNLLILPYSIPFFISVLVFKGMLNKDFGVVNQLLSTLSLGPIPWLEDGLWAKVSCLLVNLWLGFPYMFLLTTGILQSIPESVYEAAKIDGANKWQSFRSITLPMILSSITPLLIGSFAFNLGNFVGIYLLTGGGPAMPDATTPAGETDILISYTYRLAFEGAMGQQFGLASSIALFIFVIIGILTYFNFKTFNKGEAS
ncbi:MAG: maltose ABC transporter permease MalF [Halobacteriovoraceae bacterium]|nr:maltose ABC transporter permease MalF [Halobacteriovoraceae bacterium]